jgi:hypothetical protein
MITCEEMLNLRRRKMKRDLAGRNIYAILLGLQLRPQKDGIDAAKQLVFSAIAISAQPLGRYTLPPICFGTGRLLTRVTY